MTISAKAIATALEEVGVLLELKGESSFKTRAYNNAARILRSLNTGLDEFLEEIDQGNVKGIGPALTDTIFTLVDLGELPYLEELRSEFPDTLLELLKISGLGAKKIRVLRDQLGINDLEHLKEACQNGELASLRGFGKKTAENILAGIERMSTYSARFLYPSALAQANVLLAALKRSKLVQQIEVAGSLRRKKETIKDIDILACSQKPQVIMETFVGHQLVERVVAQGPTKSSVLLQSGISVDLRVVKEKEFPAALQYFTGSKEHNTEMRTIAKSAGYKLNEYGLFKGKRALSLKTEKELYEKLGLKEIPPELREANGEFEAAKDSKLPKLVKLKDIKGILHAHSHYSDGENSLREMAQAVKEAGYEYFGISDHSQSAAYASGLKAKDIKRQHKEIDELNQELAPFRIFKGIESDILEDGSLDYPESVLESFDFIIASVHSRFGLTEKQMTKRIQKALMNPFTTILGHPSGRLLLKREAYQINMHEILETAAEYGVAIELNANPQRLDLDWRFLRRAKDLEIPIPISPDAHSVEGLYDLKYGLGIARKGWLSKENVLNCFSLKEIEEFFQNK